MVTRHGRPRPLARLRLDALEPRLTPAASQVIDFGAGFTEDRLPGGLPAGYTDHNLLLTDGPFQARAVWAPTPLDLRAFQTSFVFRLEGEPGRLGDGFTFALAGTPPPAPGTAGGGLGYQGITNSVAVKFDLVDNAGEGAESVGVFTGGAEPTTPAVSLDGTPINLYAQHPIRADIGYDGTTRTLTLALTDTTVPDRTWTHEFAVDIPAALGSATGYAGFTAGTGELFARQAVESWTLDDQASAGQPPTVSPISVQLVGPGHLNLSAQATDDGNLAALTYTWEVVTAPNGGHPPLLELPGQFPGTTRAIADDSAGVGRYTFRLTVRDEDGQAVSREVNYDFSTTVTRIAVTPEQPTVAAGGTVQFVAAQFDGAGRQITDPLTPYWSVVSGPGTIDQAGRYTAPAGASGSVTVRAEVSLLNSASVRADATVPIEGVPPAGGPDFGTGFDASSLSETGSSRVTDDHRLRLADGPFQAGSAFSGPVDVRGFTTSFRFQVGNVPSGEYGDGLTFVLQNAGPTTVGVAGAGLGYAGITDSVAVKFDLVDNTGEGPESVGVFTGGAEPTTPADGLPPGQDGAIHLNSGHVFRVNLTYADGTLRVELFDTVTGVGFHRAYSVDIPAAVGGPKAYAGFTAGTGSLFAPIDVLDWTFAPN